MNGKSDASNDDQDVRALQCVQTRRAINAESRTVILRGLLGFAVIAVVNAIMLRLPHHSLFTPLGGVIVLATFFIVLATMVRYVRLEMMRSTLRRHAWRICEGSSSSLYLASAHVAHACIIHEADKQLVRVCRKMKRSDQVSTDGDRLWVVQSGLRLIVSLPGGGTPRWAYRVPISSLRKQIVEIVGQNNK